MGRLCVKRAGLAHIANRTTVLPAESGVPGRVTLTVVFGYGGYGVTS